MKKQKLNKKKLNKPVAFAATATALAIVIGTTGIFNYLQPIEAYARESFSGTKQIVQKHTDEPFVILDIVPAYATYTWSEDAENPENSEVMEFSAGTLSALVKGQAVMEEEYAKVYESKASELKKYEARKAFADAVWLSAPESDTWGIRYEEAYAGTRKELESAADIEKKGWHLLIEQEELPEEEKETGESASAGLMYGYYIKYEEQPTASPYVTATPASSKPDKAGYDYIKVGEWEEEDTYKELTDAVYVYNKETGNYQLGFEEKDASEASDDQPVSGYLMVSADEITAQNVSEYSDATGVYTFDEESGRYYYAGVLGDYRSAFDMAQEAGSEATATPSATPIVTPSVTPTVTPSAIPDVTPTAEAAVTPGVSPSAVPSAELTPEQLATPSAIPTVAPPIESSAMPSATPSQEPVPEASEVPAAEPTTEPIDEPGEEPTAEPTVEPTTEPIDEPGEEPTANPTAENAQEPEEGEVSSQAVLGVSRKRTVETDNTVIQSDGNNSAENNAENDAENDAENSEENSTVSGDVYYVLTFEYFEEITDPAQIVYRIAWAEEIPEDAQAQERPADAYSLLTAENGKITLYNEDTEDTEEDTEENKVFLYVGSGLGEYRLVEQAEVNEEYRTKYPPVKMEVRNAPTYFRFTGGCDWLKEAVFHSLEGGDNANVNFKLQVVTLRADELTMDLIDKADLVYLENGNAPFLHTKGDNNEAHAELYRLDKDSETVKDKETGQILGMTRENVYALAYRAVNEQLPIMLDYSITENDILKDSNYQALAGIFLKKDLETYVLDAKTDKDWLVEHLEDEAYPDKTANENHYVNKNIYVINSSTPLVNGDFKESFTYESAVEGFDEVLNFIRSENMLSGSGEEEQIPETVNKARAIEYIINYAVGLVADYADMKILELQPSDNDVPDLFGENTSGGTTLYFKKNEVGSRKKQVLRSSSEIDVDVTIKSPAAFNSEWTDLNSTYNLIFIGLDGQKLNHSSELWDTIKYNDDELEGKLYHSGDLAAGTDERYDAIDITAGKKQALLDFMKAGYPVLLENDFFKGKTAKNASESDINTEYVAADTQMYQFLKEAVENEEYRSRIYTIEDVYSNVMFRAQIATDRPVISLSDENASSELAYVEKQEGGIWNCNIFYQISSLYGGAYSGDRTVECYLDINDDGGYCEEEKISGQTGESAGIWAVDEGGKIVVNFAQDPGSRAIPYRLVVYANGNAYLRTEVKGILQITSTEKEKIRVLQIGNQDATSLEVLYEQENSVLSYYLKEAESALNAELEITTMSMGESGQVDGKNLATMLGENPDYLKRYDILVLGFGNGADDLTAEAADKINSFMEEGRSVLVSYKGAVEEENRLSLSAELLGQMQNKTYVKLGRDSGNELFRYSGMRAGMFSELTGLYADGINEGSVYHYPNEIGKTMGFSSATSLIAGDYRLNLSNEAIPYVTPWFVLNGNEGSAYAYQVSGHDGGNNYYLYSRGNVVYIGHQDYSGYTYQADNEQNPIGEGLNECQMFVNAMVLAYNAGIHDIKVDFVAGFEETAAKVESVSIPFDQEIAEEAGGESGLLDETVDLYFKYKDSNLAVQKDYEISFYYEDAAGSVQLDTGEKLVSVTPFTSELWTVEENAPVQVSASELEQGKVYRLKAPAEALKNNTSVTQAGIYVEIRCKLDRPGGEKTVRGCDNVALNRVQLFMLE